MTISSSSSLLLLLICRHSLVISACPIRYSVTPLPFIFYFNFQFNEKFPILSFYLQILSYLFSCTPSQILNIPHQLSVSLSILNKHESSFTIIYKYMHCHNSKASLMFFRSVHFFLLFICNITVDKVQIRRLF
jgi:hypothetical protein